MTRAYLRQLPQFLLALAVLAAAGCGGSAPAGKTKEAPRVTVAHPVLRKLVDEDDYTGWLRAFKTVEVRARVRGHIMKVHFHDGDSVKEGQPLFDLDPAPFQAELKQAEAQAKAFAAQTTAAEKVAERNRILRQTNAVSPQDLEKSEADAEALAAQTVARRSEAERYRLDLQYAKITAPLSGRISKAELVEGNLVNAGGSDPLLTTIVAIDPIYVEFTVDERAIQRYQNAAPERREGGEQPQSLREQKLPFSFGLDLEKGFPHNGQLVFADNRYIEGTGTILMRGIAKNADGRLIPGSRVRVRVPVSESYEAVVAPDSAVLSDLDRKYLLVLGKDNTVLRRDITPGRLLDDGMRVILPAAGEEQAAQGKEWVKDWEQRWIITLGLQRARIDYPVLPLDSSGQPINAAVAPK